MPLSQGCQTGADSSDGELSAPSVRFSVAYELEHSHVSWLLQISSMRSDLGHFFWVVCAFLTGLQKYFVCSGYKSCIGWVPHRCFLGR